MYLGEGKNPRREHLLELRKKYGLKNSDEVIVEVERAVGKWKTFTNVAGVSKKSSDSIAKVLTAIMENSR